MKGLSRGVPAILLATIGLALATIAATNRPSGDSSPHADALALVIGSEGKVIASLENDHENWWHDTKSRQWQVTRPFVPGILDSAHQFVVVYSIDGHEAAQWTVDTRSRKVTRGDTLGK